ncbi:MAG: riboflavin synthase [Planctomycetota bacterium]|jgi:riboflavin synthase|nr:riboflavin synthase [Planctomycetota bacterium]
MFTGLIVEIGLVTQKVDTGRVTRLEVEAPSIAPKVEIGASVAVSGVCLTVVEINDSRLAFEMIPETLDRTHLGSISQGDGVNLEGALCAGDPLGGHFVQGHVDGVGTTVRNQLEGEEHILEVALPADQLRFLVEKGSVAIDGVSLTVTEVGPESFAVALIPHTLDVTTLSRLRPGDPVHIEVDILAKYVQNLLPPAG